MTASPSANYLFSAWSGTGTGSYTGASNPATPTINGALTETAAFVGVPESFSATAGANGVVTCAYTSNSVSTPCVSSYPYGMQITVTAAPAMGYALSYWTCTGGTCSPTTSSPTVVTIGGTTTVVATFGSLVGTFNGQTSYVSVASSSLVTGNQLTMSFWANEIGSGNAAPRAIAVSQSATYVDLCYSSEGLFSIYTGTSSQYLVQGGTCPSVGVWRHYVVTYNGVAGVLYINGAKVASGSDSGSLVNGAVTIGQYYGGSYNFNGLLSNVQFYNTAMSATVVNALYQEGRTGAPLANNGLVAWYPLSGSANDLSGNGHNSIGTTAVTYVTSS
jgi:hypothetical protein